MMTEKEILDAMRHDCIKAREERGSLGSRPFFGSQADFAEHLLDIMVTWEWRQLTYRAIILGVLVFAVGTRWQLHDARVQLEIAEDMISIQRMHCEGSIYDR